MPKIEIILKPAEKSDYKSPYLDNLNRRYPDNNNEVIEISNVKPITPINDHFINEYTTFTQLRSGIQFTQSMFKSIKFDNNQKR